MQRDSVSPDEVCFIVSEKNKAATSFSECWTDLNFLIMPSRKCSYMIRSKKVDRCCAWQITCQICTFFSMFERLSFGICSIVFSPCRCYWHFVHVQGTGKVTHSLCRRPCCIFKTFSNSSESSGLVPLLKTWGIKRLITL